MESRAVANAARLFRSGMAVGTRTGIAQPTDISRLIPSSSFKEIPIERFIWSLPEL
jgi:hypothetical protein